jgi:hypothetical protein
MILLNPDPAGHEWLRTCYPPAISRIDLVRHASTFATAKLCRERLVFTAIEARTLTRGDATRTMADQGAAAVLGPSEERNEGEK